MAKILRNIDQIIDTQGNELSVANPVEVPAPVLSFRNKLINGNFDIWQRGTSPAVQAAHSADRWLIDSGGFTELEASQQAFTLGQTDVPGNPKYYLRHVVTNTDAWDWDYARTGQRIEGVDTLSGQTVTLSFWAKADSNKNIATEFVQDFDGEEIEEIGVTTHSLTTSWQKFTTTVSIPSISGKTIGTYGFNHLAVYFWFDASGEYDDRTNSLGFQSGTFDIAQVQLEEGSVATLFEHLPLSVELAMCQRYYQIIETSHQLYGADYGGTMRGYTTFFNTMRAIPSVTFTGEYPSWVMPTTSSITYSKASPALIPSIALDAEL